MPILGIGLHVIVALYFAIHAMRTGQQMYWLFVLFSFPLLGSVVYFVAIYLPNSRLEHGARKMVIAAAKSLDPTRELREAREAFSYTPSAQNQMRLAKALLEAGDAEEAANNYEACLTGPFASDNEIKFCAARAFVESARYARAVLHLEEVQQANPSFRAEQISILLARALAGAQRHDEANTVFEGALKQFGSFDVKSEYAIWALSTGRQQLAQSLLADIEQITQRWNRHSRDVHGATLKRIDAAKALTK